MLRILVLSPIRISYFTSGISTMMSKPLNLEEIRCYDIELLSGRELDSFKIDEVKNGGKGDSGA